MLSFVLFTSTMGPSYYLAFLLSNCYFFYLIYDAIAVGVAVEVFYSLFQFGFGLELFENSGGADCWSWIVVCVCTYFCSMFLVDYKDKPTL